MGYGIGRPRNYELRQWKYGNTLISFTGRFTYAYKDRYLMTATARYDGSSRFGTNNKWGFFPSVGLGWRISEETFLANNKVITNLKLRGSYGITGNQEIGNYKSLAQLKSKITFIMTHSCKDFMKQ